MANSWTRARVAAAVVSVSFASALVVFAGCGEDDSSSTPPTRTTSLAPRARSTAAAAAGPVCTAGTGAHDKHAFQAYGCALCHPCAGVYAINSVTLPGGTDTTGGQLTRSTSSTAASCTVACHNMSGTNQSISWTAAGPLACSSCHSQGSQSTTARSTHFAAATTAVENRAACQTCHDTSQHLSGQVVLAGPNGTITFRLNDPSQVDPVCNNCHDGTGKILVGKTPPLLVGYADASGDFHGSRAGTGFGGTLAAPYQRGQAALPCESCHDAHSSGNSFLFAGTVNGGAIASATISRAGVGAEALCTKCHLSDFHAGCKTAECHGSVYASATLVPMSNQPCFYCHGHEGVVNFSMPTWDNHPQGTGYYCGHCHNKGWYPTTVVTTPPAISNAGVSLTSTQTSVTGKILWDTNRPSTSYVEFGTTDASAVVGNNALVTHHEVALPALTAGTTYQYRIRTSDAFRNIAFSPAPPATSSFTAPLPGVPIAPTPVAVDTQAYEYYTPSFTAALQWNAVTFATSYRVVVAKNSNGSFTDPRTIVLDQTITGTSINLTQSLPDALYPTIDRYYWRVMAIATAGNSAWSSTSTFNAYQWMMM